MFVRLKPNKSGSTSVQVISKTPKYHVVKTFGSATSPKEIDYLRLMAENYISGEQIEFPFKNKFGSPEFFLKNIQLDSVTQIGPELVFGSIFDEIGFNKINSEIFRYLVISRIVYPYSKSKTVRYLNDYTEQEMSVDSVYRFMDELGDKYKGEVSKIAYEYTKSKVGQIKIVFYDITTLYFESATEDEYRIPGYNKDGKFHKPQILLAFLLAQNGFPITYEIFEGDTYEGHTFVPSIIKTCKKYDLRDPVIIADSGMLSNNNLTDLESNNLDYVVGARIKSQTSEVKSKILSLDFSKELIQEIELENKRRLIVTYSDKRAKKDAFNRDKGLKKLEKKVGSGKLTKSNINNRGYNKFLKMSGNTKISIDKEKIEEDRYWDGLKGYITNTSREKLNKNEVVNSYSQLWLIEKSFKISKTDLKLRPIYHRLLNRIRAHIAIAFCAYTILLECNLRLKDSNSELTYQRVIELSSLVTRANMSLKKDPNVRFSILIQFTEEMKSMFDDLKVRVSHCGT